MAASRAHRDGLYLGEGAGGPVFAPPEHGLLVLGPPRSGKTAAVVVPNVLKAAGSVLAVSTKRDVLDTTASARARLGPVLCFDPSGTLDPPPPVRRIGWSPVAAARRWDHAVLLAESMVGASRPSDHADAVHWNERAGALLATLLHAAALAGTSMYDVVAAVNRRRPERFLDVLARHGAALALDLLTGIVETDEREQSGIWSTASGILAAYRTHEALDATRLEPFDARRFVAERATLYVAVSGEHQRHLAPLVAGIVRDVRSAAYAARARDETAPVPRPPVLLVLDELANIAPLHDLPALVAEGASQGLVTLACLQDLSQARGRFGALADGFLSLFGAKLVLGGIGDVRTLDTLARLAGELDVPSASVTFGAGGTFLRRRSTTVAPRRVPRLPADRIARPPGRHATAVLGARPARVALTPWYASSPWREAAGLDGPRHAPGRDAGREGPATLRR
ncbi:MAG TPA: type IV secretory system conjugative DNA transfer family protein [Acidimicrobiales bacterium]|nr:type IV secretory system conjugative DNA transfer family protein [Acidimicrobiales bacterium]